MRSRFCTSCGGSNFRADRALAGRLVCIDCGMALGQKNTSGRYSYSNIQKNRPINLFLLLFAVSAIIVILI